MSETEIIERMFRGTQYTRRVRLVNVVASLASEVLGHDPIQAEEYAEVHKVSIWNHVGNRRKEELKKGLHPTFEISDQTRYELAWYPARTARDSDETTELKSRLAYRGCILDYIDELVNSWRAYEALGCLMCQLAGASQALLTEAGDDWNIDFLALVPTPGETHLFPSVGHQIRIVGQSKGWNTSVPRSEIQLLTSTLDDIRRRNEEVVRRLPAWFLSARDPIVGVMIAHSGVDAGGLAVAGDHGIVIADSRDIAQIVCLSQFWDNQAGVGGTIDRLEKRIEEILSQQGAT